MPYTQRFSGLVQFEYNTLAIADANCKLRSQMLSEPPACNLNASFYANRSHTQAKKRKFNLYNAKIPSGW